MFIKLLYNFVYMIIIAFYWKGLEFFSNYNAYYEYLSENSQIFLVFA